MSQGRPAAILWRFTIPMLLSAVFQQLYNVADSVVAGRFVGEDALAAVGASFPITMIFMAVALGSILYVGYAPGQTALGASRPLPEGADAVRLAAALLEEHGLATLVVALLALAAAVATRLRREAR